jgi:hypothetical protein
MTQLKEGFEMSKIRLALTLALLAAVLIPASIQAAGTFYCSALKSSGGVGTYENPWPCATDAQLNAILQDYICDQYGGGNLYRIFSGSYILYRAEWATVNGQTVCQISYSATYSGTPPNTGVPIPMPLLLGGGVLFGAILLGVGFALRKPSERNLLKEL